MSTEREDFERAMLLLGWDGSGPIPVLVDAAGNIVAVMKGDYAGALKTIALDEEGRMQALIVDVSSPWGLEGNIGLAQLASRLGAQMRYDYRGDLLWAWGFEYNLPSPWTATFGGGATGAIVTNGAAYGSKYYEITLPGAGPGTGKVETAVSTAAATQAGLEAAIMMDDMRGVVEMRFNSIHDGGYEYGAIKIDNWSPTQLYYLNSVGGWTSFDIPSNAVFYSDTWARAKLVCDFENGKYMRFMLDRYDWDLSAYDMQTGAAGGIARIDIQLSVATDSAVDNHISFDNLILTNNEPPNE